MHLQQLNKNLCGEDWGLCILYTLHRGIWGSQLFRVPALPQSDDWLGWSEKGMKSGWWEGGGESEFLWLSGGNLQDRRGPHITLFPNLTWEISYLTSACRDVRPGRLLYEKSSIPAGLASWPSGLPGKITGEDQSRDAWIAPQAWTIMLWFMSKGECILKHPTWFSTLCFRPNIGR